MFVILLSRSNLLTTEGWNTEVQSQHMAFTQSPSISNNPKILNNYRDLRVIWNLSHFLGRTSQKNHPVFDQTHDIFA